MLASQANNGQFSPKKKKKKKELQRPVFGLLEERKDGGKKMQFYPRQIKTTLI